MRAWPNEEIITEEEEAVTSGITTSSESKTGEDVSEETGLARSLREQPVATSER